MLLLLLSNPDIQVNIRDDKGRTPLHHAIMRNHTSICNILLNHRARVNVSEFKINRTQIDPYRIGAILLRSAV